MKIKLEHEDNGLMLYGEMETQGAVLGFASHKMRKMNLADRYRKSSLEQEPFGQDVVFISDDVNSAYKNLIEAGAISVAEPLENRGADRPYVIGDNSE